jgi:periplasmic divalent cation tolerance protein
MGSVAHKLLDCRRRLAAVQGADRSVDEYNARRPERLVMVPGCVQVSTTLPDENTAQRVGRSLVEERLAACAQVVGPVSSSYWWRGAVEQSREWYCYLKTTTSAFPALRQRLEELHPYDVPEIIAVPVVEGSSEYLRWIEESLVVQK